MGLLYWFKLLFTWGEKKKKISKMSFLRRSNRSLIQSIRQLTITNVAQTNRENAVRTVGVAGGLNIVQATQKTADRSEAARSLVAHIKTMVNVNPECMIGNHKRNGLLPIFTHCSFFRIKIGTQVCGCKARKSAFSM